MIEMGHKKQARSFFNVGMAKKFMQTVLVADALSELQRADLTTSLREIYYRTKHTIQDSHENTFDTQDESDPVIEDLEVSLAALREELHVRAENSGSIVGPVIFGDDGIGWTVHAWAKGLFGTINRGTRVSGDPSLHRRLLALGRKRYAMESLVGRQVLAAVQLRPPDRKRSATERREASRPAAP
jgi:hypothetical protein